MGALARPSLTDTQDGAIQSAPGARVLIAREKATVRYIGPVEGQTGCWAGVEWDDPARGKHDGSARGVAYFAVASPGGGSFVRLEKVHAGCSLEQALLARYAGGGAGSGGGASGGGGGGGDADNGAAVAAHAQQQHAQAYVLTSSQRKLFVQLVGEDAVAARQSRVDLLTSARLVGLGVARVGPTLAALAPSLTELDLSDNLLTDWQHSGAAACAALPRLAALNLSANRLADLSPPPPPPPLLPTALRTLVLNDTGVTFAAAATLQRACLPALAELRLCGNNIASLDTSGDSAAADAGGGGAQSSPFARLELLDLERNALSDWAEVVRLGQLPTLRCLLLGANPLTAVADADADAGTPPQPSSSSPPFAALEELLLGGCRLARWRDVDALARQLPRLSALRLSGNPLLEGAHGGGRYEIIGRIGGLTMLNGAAVRPRERRDSELRYLHAAQADVAAAAKAADAAAAAEGSAAGSAASPASASPSAAVAAVEASHPRLRELAAKYGQASASAGAGAAAPTTGAAAPGTALGTQLVELVLRHGARSTRKRLPRGTTVGALRGLACRLLRAPPDGAALLLLPPPSCDDGAGGDEPEAEDIGGDDTKPLAFFDIQPGSVVEVVSGGEAAARAAAAAAHAAAAEAELAARTAAQLRDAERICAAAAH